MISPAAPEHPGRINRVRPLLHTRREHDPGDTGPYQVAKAPARRLAQPGRVGIQGPAGS